MPAKRRVSKAAPHRVTPEALAAFTRLQAAEKTCTCAPRDWGGEYWKHEPCQACEECSKANSLIHAELELPPWEWPAAVANPEAKNPYPKGSYAARRWRPDERATSLYRELMAAAGEDFDAWRAFDRRHTAPRTRRK